MTFVHLFINMRKVGSSFWLREYSLANMHFPVHRSYVESLNLIIRSVAFTTLISSIFGFLTSLLAAHLLNIPIDPVCLSEALPFLVITIGFDKPFMLAKAIFQNPEIAPVAVSPSPSPKKDQTDPFVAKGNGDAPGNGLGLDLGALHKELAPLERLQRLAEGKGVRWAAPIAAKEIVVDAVRKKGVSIVRGYAVEIAALSVGALSGIGGLREFCYLGRSCGEDSYRF